MLLFSTSLLSSQPHRQPDWSKASQCPTKTNANNEHASVVSFSSQQIALTGVYIAQITE